MNACRALLFPACGWKALRASFGIALVGALFGGVYGILHDQITYTLSEEYFTRLKFQQFGFQDSDLHPRVLVGMIGFMATWWVGLITGWMIARMGTAQDGSLLPLRAFGRIGLALFSMLILAALMGYGFGLLCYETREAEWAWAAILNGVNDVESFAKVGYIHNFAYLGGVAGTVICMIWARSLVKSS